MSESDADLWPIRVWCKEHGPVVRPVLGYCPNCLLLLPVWPKDYEEAITIGEKFGITRAPGEGFLAFTERVGRTLMPMRGVARGA